MIAAVYDWSGFYVGLNGGGGWSGKCWDIVTNILGAPVVPPVSEGCHTASGAVAGGQFGYRWQTGAWVFGVEAQGDLADLSGSNGPSLLTGCGGSNRSKIDAIGLFAGQVGYAWDNVLLYVKGGVIGVSDKYEGFTTATSFVFDRASETRWNGAVGAGLDFGVTPNIVLGVDYVHGFMGTRDNSFTFNAADSHAPIAFVRTSTSSPRASATNSAAPSSRNTDSARRALNTERPVSRRPFCLVVPRNSAHPLRLHIAYFCRGCGFSATALCDDFALYGPATSN